MITKKMQPLLAIFALPLLLGACKKSPTPFPEVSEPYAITHAPGEHFLANYFGINAWSPHQQDDMLEFSGGRHVSLAAMGGWALRFQRLSGRKIRISLAKLENGCGTHPAAPH